MRISLTEIGRELAMVDQLSFQPEIIGQNHEIGSIYVWSSLASLKSGFSPKTMPQSCLTIISCQRLDHQVLPQVFFLSKMCKIAPDNNI